MNILNLFASFGASAFVICGGGFCLMVAMTAIVTVFKCAAGVCRRFHH